MKTIVPILLIAVALAGCGQSGTGSQIALKAPTLDQVKNLTYAGIEDEPVTLTDGEWEGEPFVEGSALRPNVHFVRDFVLIGDLDGDMGDEAVVLLGNNEGGTGEYVYLAVTGFRDGAPANLATVRLGDRVQVVSAKVIEGDEPRLEVELLEAGPDDGACCPGNLVSHAWTFGARGLSPLALDQEPRRLSLDILADREWVLRHWTWDEHALEEPEVTLNYAEGKFSGSNGCNNYFAGVEEGGSPGDITVGPGGSTKMFCPDPAGTIEHRFGGLLGSVKKYGFMAGQLVLSYQFEDQFGVMIFEGREREESE
jgi:heat shock protein HslJ